METPGQYLVDEQKSVWGFKHPTPEQLEKINKFTPADASPLEAKEVVVVAFEIADNLLNRSYGVWDTETLDEIASLVPGLPLTLDHDWDQIQKEQGKFFDAYVEKRDAIASSHLLNKAGNFDNNRQLVQRNGYKAVVGLSYLSADSPVLNRLRMGFHGSVSLGAFRVKDYFCPLCDDSFNNCPHDPPYPGLPWTPDSAPFHIRKGITDAGEVSLVLIPNLPNAGLIRRA